MLDAILYVAQFDQLVAHLDTHHPEMLQRDEYGEMVMPPVVTGFSRTPAAVNGNSLMVYARLRVHEADQWRDMPHMEVLAEAEYTGYGTGKNVYDQVFNDPDKLAKYKAVYDFTPYTVTDEESGETFTITPPEYFGLMAGA